MIWLRTAGTRVRLVRMISCAVAPSRLAHQTGGEVSHAAVVVVVSARSGCQMARSDFGLVLSPRVGRASDGRRRGGLARCYRAYGQWLGRASDSAWEGSGTDMTGYIPPYRGQVSRTMDGPRER